MDFEENSITNTIKSLKLVLLCFKLIIISRKILEELMKKRYTDKFCQFVRYRPNRERYNVPGEDLVSKPKSQGEAASGGGNREVKTIREALAAPQLRVGVNVLRGRPAWCPRSTSLHCSCHG